MIVSAEGVFVTQGFDEDAGVKKGRAEEPEGRGELAGLQIISPGVQSIDRYGLPVRGHKR